MGTNSTSEDIPSEKKAKARKRNPGGSTSKSSKSKQSTPRKRSTKKEQDENSTTPYSPSVAITTVLVMDTGGWTVKHGSFHNPSYSNDTDVDNKVAIPPNQSPNARAKPKHQLTLLTADEIHSIQNKGQLDFIRPMERGYVTDLGTQMAVWERILDMEGIASSIPKTSTKKRVRTPPPSNTNAASTSVLLLNQPFTPRCTIDREDEIWFRDFGFAKVGRRLIQCMSARHYSTQLAPNLGTNNSNPTTTCTIIREKFDEKIINDNTGCCCVVDSGFSLTHIVPTVEGLAIESAIRRVNVGGKLLTNLLKESISYRQWNMMDEYMIVNEAKEKLCYVSTNFDDEMNTANNIRKGMRPFDREFVLPDFVDTIDGFVRLPIGLQNQQNRESSEGLTSQNVTSKKDSPINDADTISGDDSQNGIEDNNNNNNTKISDDEAQKQNEIDEDDDSDEESEEQIRKRILKQREEEKRRREIEEQERQVLNLSVERFAVPEVLFRPTDIGLHQSGVAEAIVSSIKACKPVYRAAMYHNIVLTGGNANIPNFAERLADELRKLAPSNYSIRIYCPKDPITYAWYGARQLAQNQEFQNEYFIDKFEWEKIKVSNDIGFYWNSLGKNFGDDFVGI